MTRYYVDESDISNPNVAVYETRLDGYPCMRKIASFDSLKRAVEYVHRLNKEEV